VENLIMARSKTYPRDVREQAVALVFEQVIPVGAGPVNPLLLFFDLLRPVVGRAGIGVGVRDRPAGPTAQRP
jgi:hypothetical protein